MACKKCEKGKKILDRGLYRTGEFLHRVAERFQESQCSFHWDDEGKEVTPAHIFKRMLLRNRRFSKSWILTEKKASALLVGCMDYRFSLQDVFGDTRHLYDFIRVPGVVLSDEVREGILLSVKGHGVSVVIVIEHTDWCAMQETSKSEEASSYPLLSKAIGEQDANWNKLISVPYLKEKIDEGKLLIVRGELEKITGRYKVKEVAYKGEDDWDIGEDK